MFTDTEKTDKTITFFNDPSGWLHQFFISEAILSILLVLCFIGIAYTDVSGGNSMRFWLWMVPVFAVAAIALEWSRYIRENIDDFSFIWHQLLHWLAVFIALKVTFILLELGRLSNDGASFVLMTIMSLATFLAGIYINWRFIVLGVFIALATVIAAYLEAYVWLLIPIVLTLIAIIFLIRHFKFRSYKKASN